MVNRLIRNSFGFTAWVIMAIGCMAINGTIALANYLGCRTTFELLNYELSPLGGDGLLGMFFQVFLREATICNLFALSLNLAEIVGFYFLFHLLLRIYEMWRERSDSLREMAKKIAQDKDGSEDEGNARLATQLIIQDAILLAILIGPLVCILFWDVFLFRYRSIAALMGIDDPALAARTIETWDIQLQGRANLLALFLAKVGAWGYIAITAISCLGVEISFKRAGESWARLTSAIGEWYKSLGQQNENGSNAPNPNTAGGDDNRNLDPSAIDPRDPPFIVDPEDDNRDIPGVDPSPEEEPQPVMGSKSGEHVTLAHAIGHPNRYWVDMETREVWDADFRKQLMESR